MVDLEDATSGSSERARFFGFGFIKDAFAAGAVAGLCVDDYTQHGLGCDAIPLAPLQHRRGASVAGTSWAPGCRRFFVRGALRCAMAFAMVVAR